MLVSDGKDTCQPPSPCSVAQRVAKGGVEMRIQAIGFNVDPEARAELECIASAGGGVYRDATDAESLREELRALTTRALRQYEPKGKPIKGGPSARQATLITPGQYTDQLLPDSERWYAIELKRGETLKASQSFIPPDRNVEISGASSSLDIVTPSFDIPAEQNSSAGNDTLFARRGFVSGRRRRLTADRRRRAGRRRRAVLQARALLPQARARGQHATRRSTTRPAASRTRRRCRSRSSAAVARRSSRRAAASPRPSTRPNEPPSTPLLAGVGGGLAGLGFAGGALVLWRRRA